MAGNKSKIDQLHDLLPKHFNSKGNDNWKAIVAALGGVDQDTADLVAEVRKQFFVKTASRPYLDRLAANNKIARPKLVGMDDSSFRDYIPVLSYAPKQVKIIIDQLLDIFFFKESTTAYITSSLPSPFLLKDGWQFEYLVDEIYQERVTFSTNDFTNISAATADEVVATINRQTKHSYATAYYDSITKNTYIKLFTNTIGSKGSVRIVGGRANTSFHFNGFIDTAGNGSNTQWTISKIGDLATFQFTGGTSPGIDQIQVGDIIIIDLPGNEGSFEIEEIVVSENKILFKNLFATPGVLTQTSSNQVKFIRPEKYVAYTSNRRAITWETKSGEIVVEMPTSPPVVKRSLKGSVHVNGQFSNMLNRDSDTSLTVIDATTFPNAGSFLLEEVNEIQSRWLTPTEDTINIKKSNARLQYGSQKYNYTSRTALLTTGDLVEGSAQILNLASVVGIMPGQDVIMDGLPGYTRVINVVGTTVNISEPASLTSIGQSINFLGNTLTGITPPLPLASGLNQFALSSLSRSSNIVTVTTAVNHGYSAGEWVIIGDNTGIPVIISTGDTTIGSNQITNLSNTSGLAPGLLVDMSGVPGNSIITNIVGTTITISEDATATGVASNMIISENINGASKILSASGTTFTYFALGSDGVATTAGNSRVEKVGLANSGSKVIIQGAVRNDITRITGSYVWDSTAPFVLSVNKAAISDEIKAGRIVRLLNIGSNTIPSTSGNLIFDYGLNTQEGPVKYLYKPTDGTIAIDPSYVFQKKHKIGSSIVALRHKGPHAMSGRGAEYAPYITDPSEARFILEELIKSVKSAGIFVNFLVRYPEQLYATLDVYKSGIDPG